MTTTQTTLWGIVAIVLLMACGWWFGEFVRLALSFREAHNRNHAKFETPGRVDISQVKDDIGSAIEVYKTLGYRTTSVQIKQTSVGYTYAKLTFERGVEE